MKLLILTQKVDVDDDILGFFHDWIIELAKHCEKVTVICLQRGRYELPKNIKVLSLGKDEFLRLNKYFGFIRKIVVTLRFYNYIIRQRNNYDRVLVHMNPEYVVLGGLLWRAWKKKIALWYTHKSVDLKLRIAVKLTDIIFTASKESFRLNSQKVRVVGHGINIEKFKIRDAGTKSTEKFKIIYVGRISRIKNQKLLIEVLNILINEQGFKNISLDLIGPTLSRQDKSYKNELEKMLGKMHLENYVKFLGSLPYKQMPSIYNQADLSINLCPTGGVDKAVLESMACGLPILVFNKTFLPMIGNYQDELVLSDLDSEQLALKIKKIMELGIGKRKEMGDNLHNLITKNHSLDKLIKNIARLL